MFHSAICNAWNLFHKLKISFILNEVVSILSVSLQIGSDASKLLKSHQKKTVRSFQLEFMSF